MSALYLRLAARNVARNLRRTALSMGSVIAGIAVIIVGRGLIGGMEENIIRAEVDGLSGHLLLRPADYPSVGLSHPVDGLFVPPPEALSAIEQAGGRWTTRLMFSPRAVHRADAVRVRAIGFDPARDPLVFARDTWNCLGADGINRPDCEGLVPTDASQGVLVAKNVADVLSLRPGDTLILETRTAQGAINALDVPVHALFTTGNASLDRFGVFVPAALAEELVRAEGATSHLIAHLPSRDNAARVRDAVAPLAPAGTEWRTWRQQCQDMLDLQQVRQTALEILITLLMVISALGIANTILMAAYERVREIGTLRAMGMTRAGVVGLFVLEGALIGLGGGLIGALIGGSLAWRWSVVGIDLSGSLDELGDIAFSTVLYTAFSPASVVGAVLFGTLVAVLGSIWPALSASAMQPADAVRAD